MEKSRTFISKHVLATKTLVVSRQSIAYKIAGLRSVGGLQDYTQFLQYPQPIQG